VREKTFSEAEARKLQTRLRDLGLAKEVYLNLTIADYFQA